MFHMFTISQCSVFSQLSNTTTRTSRTTVGSDEYTWVMTAYQTTDGCNLRDKPTVRVFSLGKEGGSYNTTPILGIRTTVPHDEATEV